MDKYKSVKQVAQQALTIRTPASEQDTTVRERAKRLVQNVDLICKQPEIAAMDMMIDKLCLYAAAWFTNAGLARHLHGKNLPLTSCENDRRKLDELSVELLRRKLGHVLDSSELENTAQIIQQNYERFTTKPEAMILSDARNLEDMGLIGVFYEHIRYAAQGKPLTFVLQSWQKKIDYQYWQARLKDSFRFDCVRKIAAQRLQNAAKTMEWLTIECKSLDLRENIAERTTERTTV